MTDENDSGIDRRNLLKKVGSVGAVGGLGAASSSTVSAYMKEPDPGDGGYGGGGGTGSSGCDSDGDYCLDGNVAQYVQEWTACAPQLTFGFGSPGRGCTIGRSSGSCVSDYPALDPYPQGNGYTSKEDGWDKIIHEDWKDRGYAIRNERISPYNAEDGAHEETWDTEGPTRGDTVFVWVHGWQNAGYNLLPWQSGPGPVQSTYKGRRQAGLAWDAINYYTSIPNIAEDNDSVHTVGFAWNSASASANFNSAVGQAHRYGPRNLAPFLVDLADRVGPRGNIHIGAHSLGCWMTLEGLAKGYHEEGHILAPALDSVRFICAAVPESSMTHDTNWINCENNGVFDYHGGTCSGSEPYRNETYNKHALKAPNRIRNVYYPGDDVVTDELQMYLSNYGSSSDAVGANPVSPKDPMYGSIQWENVEATNVENHSNSYKHPAYADDAGCGQNVIWNEWVDIGRDCNLITGEGDYDRGDGTRGDGDRDRGDRDRTGRDGSSGDRTGDYDGGSYGGGGDRTIRRR